MPILTASEPPLVRITDELKPILHYFYHWEQTQPDKVYLRQPYGKKWHEYTWREVGRQARQMAAALRAMNLPPQSNIGLIAKNCAHWIIADLAMIISGHVSVPFYTSLTAGQLNQVLTHSGCEVLFVGKVENWESMKAGIPDAIRCIALPDSPAHKVEQWNEIIAGYEPITGNPTPRLSDLMTIIYTSGTTGNPKGVMITVFANAAALASTIPILQVAGNDCRFFSYLPLCHVAERAVVETLSLYSGGTVFFAESLEAFMQNLQEAQPTHFIAVPRIWSKFQLGVLAKMPQKRLDTLLLIPIVAGLMRKKIRKGLGLDSARLILTGAAPMPVSLLQWYQRLGIYIQEVYGMTENQGVCSFMQRGRMKLGTVGQPYPGAVLKIDPQTGELLMQSDWLMQGYYREPEITAAAFRDGYLCTGDVGELDEEGFLRITGRVKDIFKSAKGEYVTPTTIEFGFATNAHVEQVCVVGVGLPQPIALIVPSEIGLKLDKTALSQSLEATVLAINPVLKDYERLRKVIVLQESWSVANGLMTPSLKIKRNVVEAKYQNRLENWYEAKGLVVWE